MTPWTGCLSEYAPTWPRDSCHGDWFTEGAFLRKAANAADSRGSSIFVALCGETVA
jgi:hypothetical protein